jgi:hypothetical protein
MDLGRWCDGDAGRRRCRSGLADAGRPTAAGDCEHPCLQARPAATRAGNRVATRRRPFAQPQPPAALQSRACDMRARLRTAAWISRGQGCTRSGAGRPSSRYVSMGSPEGGHASTLIRPASRAAGSCLSWQLLPESRARLPCLCFCVTYTGRCPRRGCRYGWMPRAAPLHSISAGGGPSSLPNSHLRPVGAIACTDGPASHQPYLPGHPPQP